MKPSLLYRSILLFFFISAGMVVTAQDDATAKFIDSLKKPPSAATDTIVLNGAENTDSARQEDSNDTADDIPIDTAIISNLRQISKDSLTLLKRDNGFYYQTTLDSLLRVDEENKRKEQNEPASAPLDAVDSSRLFFVFKMLLVLIAVAVLGFVIYKLFLGKSALFLSNRKNIEIDVNIEEEIQGSEYDSLIKKAEAENNYRLAVRYLYLQALHGLAEKEYIAMATEKTNYQYINELRKRTPAIVGPFTDLTRQYEYIWYGGYEIANVTYSSLQQEFIKFNKQTASY